MQKKLIIVNPQDNGNTGRIINVQARGGMAAWDVENGNVKSPNQRFALSWFDSKTGQKKLLWKEIDKASRVVFPLMFLLFMLIYFPILLSRAF
ncbi:hypothetical protein SK128_011014 [Halocaridina rubra]|uniref:Uncharacterized protein n=1 Tax=Halocaridina rubra TaxID=373956 RepID=A0AAN8XNV9_HALRR